MQQLSIMLYILDDEINTQEIHSQNITWGFSSVTPLIWKACVVKPFANLWELALRRLSCGNNTNIKV